MQDPTAYPRPTTDTSFANDHSIDTPPRSMASSMAAAASGDPSPRTSGGSSRSSQGRRTQNPQQQLSQIEKSVTHLLVATKQLLETLTLWSRGTATEGEVSDVYVRLGYEFNIASRAFNAIGVDTTDLGNVPELLRTILEETLSQEASQASLDRFLPRIRDIIINLLHGLKRKQQRLRQRSGREGGPNGVSPRQGSVASSSGDVEDIPARASSATARPPTQRTASGDHGMLEGRDVPPRTTSAPGGRASPNKYDSLPTNPRAHRSTAGNRDTVTSSDSSLSSNTMQNMPVIAPYPQDETMPNQENPPPPYVDFPPPPPPPPPAKQQDALAALQRGGELERRASRRFSAYQIQKHLGGTNGIPMIPPAQNSPIPNRGRDVRESMNAVRTRGSVLHGRTRSNQRVTPGVESSPNRNAAVPRRISEASEETSQGGDAISIKPPHEPPPVDSPTVKTPEDKLGKVSGYVELDATQQPVLSATLSGPIEDVALAEALDNDKSVIKRQPTVVPARHGSRKVKTPSPPQSQQFLPEQSPQPGKELTLFLQYKTKIKKFVLPDGGDLTIARLQLAFIEKFNWNTHSNGIDLPEIYIQDPVSGVRHELEDLSDIKDRCVLVLNIEVLDEVKRHIDDGLGGLRTLVEGIKATVDDQQSALHRVSERQQEAAREIAGIAAAPSITSARASMLGPSSSSTGTAMPMSLKDTGAQLSEVQSLRRDLAVVRQTYTSFVSDIEASMSAIRHKASSVKSTAFKAAIPRVDGDSGRAYVNSGKKSLSDDSEKIVNRVDDLQDMVEDLRKDVVSRGVRPLPRQLETVAKDIATATAELKKMQDFLKREKPIWTKIWEQELQTVCEERDLLTMQEELAADLEDDLEKASQTFALVEQATKQQNLQAGGATTVAGGRSASGRNLHAVAMDKAVDPRAAKDGVLGEVRALQPNHEGRLEAIERAEKARQRELESRRGGEFQKELGAFVEEGKLKKTGGVEEAERLRKMKDERARKEFLEFQQQRAAERAAAKERARAEAAEEERKQAEGGEQPGTPDEGFKTLGEGDNSLEGGTGAVNGGENP